MARGPDFFLSQRGARDPAAELEATLRGLHAPESAEAGAEPLHCRFPARARWLARALDAPELVSARAPCPELDAWRRELRPVALTLVFPEAFMGSPASMFGHTLLRVDVSTDDESANLLAWALDFTADTGGEAGPVYLAKGALGLYPGRFGLNPYFEKLKLYSEWQNRDIWEYRLDLEPDEIELVLLHLWELRTVDFPYFFFDENCSYYLLRLLQIVREDLRLEHGFPVGVLPIDTARDAIDEVGLVEEVRYRPAPATEIAWRLHTQPRAVTRAALALASGELDPDDPSLDALSPRDRARALELAYDAVRFEFLEERLPEDVSRSRGRRLLLARSRLGAVEDAAPPPRPETPPDRGHGTFMLALGSGVDDGDPFVDLRIRPALHGRLDPGGGQAPDASVRVLDTTVRVRPESGDVRLEELVALALRSQGGRDRFFRPLSWHVETGAYTRVRPSGGGRKRRTVWRTGAGLGLTWAARDWIRATGFADLRAEVGGTLRNDLAFGPGGSVEIDLGHPDAVFRSRLRASVYPLVAGDTSTVVRAEIDHSLRLSRQLALVGEVGWNLDEGDSWLDARLELRFYH